MKRDKVAEIARLTSGKNFVSEREKFIFDAFTNVIIARLRKCSDLIREGKVFVENKTKVASGVGCSDRAVLNFTELLFKPNKKKFSFRRVESE